MTTTEQTMATADRVASWRERNPEEARRQNREAQQRKRDAAAERIGEPSVTDAAVTDAAAVTSADAAVISGDGALVLVAQRAYEDEHYPDDDWSTGRPSDFMRALSELNRDAAEAVALAPEMTRAQRRKLAAHAEAVLPAMRELLAYFEKHEHGPASPRCHPCARCDLCDVIAGYTGNAWLNDVKLCRGCVAYDAAVGA